MQKPKLSPTNSPTSQQVRKLSFDKNVPQLAKYTSTFSSLITVILIFWDI